MSEAKPIPQDVDGYDDYIERMRQYEYPMLKDTVYLDHAGTTLYSLSLMDRFHRDMMANLYGNPHSASLSSQKSTQEVESVRLQLLRFFNADPEHFDLVFTANATAAMKLVGEALREWEEGFGFGYHVDGHTSLVGLRELAREHVCFEGDECVKNWIEESGASERPRLFAYPAQSNMNGRRLPLDWCTRIRERGRCYTLLDAAALVSTSPIDLSDGSAPDFTAISLYKIFGFPDLGALIVRKNAAHVFDRGKYFGGGTVDVVSCIKEQWHAKKAGPLHERLEDGTLPIHSIIALQSALQTHEELFGSLDQISRHTLRLAQELYSDLSSLRHWNDEPVCGIYKDDESSYLDPRTQGPTIAFNFKDSKRRWVSNTEVEKLASIRNIHLRTGGVCNPGGVAQALDLKPWELQENFSAGHRCGSENDVLNGKPTGVIRVSLGAMSTRSDVHRFLGFVREFFVDETPPPQANEPELIADAEQRWHVESLTVYPIKSCSGYQIPHGQSWEVRPHGLVWDREWCILHKGTGKALSQKQNPRMALIRPTLDFTNGLLRITAVGSADEVVVPLSKDPSAFVGSSISKASVCGEDVDALVYSAPAISCFLTRILGVPCVLGRHNPAASFSRHCKPHLRPGRRAGDAARPIYMANESPILTISRSSLNRLNEDIKAKGGKAAHPSVFRANIVLAEDPLLSPGLEQPWMEDRWTSMRVGGDEGVAFSFLGGCRRCQMVCVDQSSAEKNPEPFVTLAKTRRFDGRVLFGVHTALRESNMANCMIKAGDVVETS